MKKSVYFVAAMCFGFVFCSCEKSNTDLGDDSRVSIETKAKMQATINKVIDSHFEVYSEEMAMASVYDASNGSAIGNQVLHRSIQTINLGSRETTEVGEWTVVSTTVSEPVRVGVREGDDPLFTITTYRVTINSTITNGEVVFNPEYILEYEDCSWSNGDTTIVFNIHWDVLDEIVRVNGNEVTDEIFTSFCEYRQNANEIGTLTTPAATAADVPFTVTIDPDHANTWLVGCSVPVNNGTMVVVLTPEGTPITSKFWDGDVNTAYNGAYYIPRAKAWYPAIASDHTDGMEWTVAGKSINMIAYTTADDYPHWGNGNSCSYGAHSVHLTGYSVVKDTENHRLVFSFNGTETGSVNY